jgi:hypothetical protein
VFRTPAFLGSCLYEEKDHALRGGGIEHVHVFNKAGMKVIGRDSGPVRSPLTDLTPGEVEELAARPPVESKRVYQPLRGRRIPCRLAPNRFSVAEGKRA